MKRKDNANSVSVSPRNLRSSTVAQRASYKLMEANVRAGRKSKSLKLSLHNKKKEESVEASKPKLRKLDSSTFSLPSGNDSAVTVDQETEIKKAKSHSVKFPKLRLGRKKKVSVVNMRKAQPIPVLIKTSEIVEGCSNLPENCENDIEAIEIVPQSNLKCSVLKLAFPSLQKCNTVSTNHRNYRVTTRTQQLSLKKGRGKSRKDSHSTKKTVIVKEDRSMQCLQHNHQVVDNHTLPVDLINDNGVKNESLKQKLQLRPRNLREKDKMDSSEMRIASTLPSKARHHRSIKFTRKSALPSKNTKRKQIVFPGEQVDSVDDDIDANRKKRGKSKLESKLRHAKVKKVAFLLKKCSELSERTVNCTLDSAKMKSVQALKIPSSKVKGRKLKTVKGTQSYLKNLIKAATFQETSAVSLGCENDFFDTRKGRKPHNKETSSPVLTEEVKLAPIFIKKSQLSEKCVQTKCPKVAVEVEFNSVNSVSDVYIVEGCHIQQIRNETTLENRNDNCIKTKEFEMYIDKTNLHGWTGTLGITKLDMKEIILMLKKIKYDETSCYRKPIALSDIRNNEMNEDDLNNSVLSTGGKQHQTSDCSSETQNSLGQTEISPSSTTTEKNEILNWVERHKPTKSENFLGNYEAVSQLKTWLNYWKSKGIDSVKCNETEGSDCGYDLSNDSEIEAPHCIMVCGPSGSGKTSLVYCLAHELGFKVFEVNASSSRSGRKVTSQLKEATQSHHVEGRTLSLDEIIALQAAEMKKYSDRPKRVNANRKCGKIGTLHKPNSSRNSKNRKSVTNKSITSFFSSTSERKSSEEEDKDFESDDVIVTESEQTVTLVKQMPSVKGLSISSCSLILFDDVDVIFKEDEGFWAAVNTFLRSTKKPVILTASSSLQNVRQNITQPHDVISLELPDMDSLSDYLTKVLHAEKLNVSLANIHHIITHLGYDVRKSLHHMQYWCKILEVLLVKDDCENGSKEVNAEVSSSEATCNQLVNRKETSIWNRLDPLPCGFLETSFKNTECIYLADVNTQQEYLNNFSLVHINLLQLLPLPSNSSCFISLEDSRGNSLAYQKENTISNKHLELSDKNIKLSNLDCSLKKHEKVEIKKNSIMFYFKRKKDELTCAVVDSLNTIANLMDGISFSDTLLQPLKTNERYSPSNNHYCYIEEFSTYGPHMADTLSKLETMYLNKAQTHLEKIMEKVQGESMALFTLPRQGGSDHRLQERNTLFDNALRNTFTCYREISNSLPPVSRLQHNTIAVDYLSALRFICGCESLKQASNLKRAGRFLHYLDSIGLGTDDKLYQLLKK